MSLGLAATAVLVFVAVPTDASAAAREPTVTVPVAGPVRVGDRVTVHLDGWEVGTVTVGVCGNAAVRGSQDCALAGDQGVAVRDEETTLVDLTVLAPPMPCPCVVRAATPAGDVVRTTPLEIEGLPVGPTVLGAAVERPGPELGLRARVIGTDESWPDSWIPPFAGPTQKMLVLTIRNRTSHLIRPLRVVPAVGRDRANAEPINPVVVRRLAAGESTQVRIAVELLAPAWGDYSVFGTVYGATQPLEFSATTSNEPWGLELLLPLLLLVWARVARRRERAQRAASAAAADASVNNLLQESSPPVSSADDGRSESPAYDPQRGADTDDSRAFATSATRT